MLPFLHRPRADFVLDMKDKDIFPGDTIDLRLYITPQEPFDVRSGTIELSCTEVYWKLVTTTTGKTTTTSNRKFKRKLLRIKQPFLSATQMTSGMTLNQSASLTIPADAPPTVSGKTANLKWELDAKLNIARMRDLHIKRELVVRSIPMAAAVDEKGWSTQSYSAEDSSPHFDLSLKLDSNTIATGQTIQGSMQARVKKPLDVRQVRVELEAREKAGNKSSKLVADTVILEKDAISFSGADFRQWGFQLKPPDKPIPGVNTSSTSVRWCVKGIMDRRMKQDPSVEKEIQVY